MPSRPATSSASRRARPAYAPRGAAGQINDEDFYATLAELNGRIDAARAAGAQDENVRQATLA